MKAPLLSLRTVGALAISLPGQGQLSELPPEPAGSGPSRAGHLDPQGRLRATWRPPLCSRSASDTLLEPLGQLRACEAAHLWEGTGLCVSHGTRRARRGRQTGPLRGGVGLRGARGVDYRRGHVRVRGPVWRAGRARARWHRVCATPTDRLRAGMSRSLQRRPGERAPASQSGLARLVPAVIKTRALQSGRAERAQQPLLRPAVLLRRRLGGPAVHPRRLCVV